VRAVVQRVSRAEVRVDGEVVGSIGQGLLVYAGVESGDADPDVELMAGKVTGLRVFEDPDGRMNLDVLDAGGGVLVVSQFTLLGDARKGRRPSFVRAEAPDKANAIYEALVRTIKDKGVPVEAGRFQAHMEVDAVNDGPVTILLDTRKTF